MISPPPLNFFFSIADSLAIMSYGVANSRRKRKPTRDALSDALASVEAARSPSVSNPGLWKQFTLTVVQKKPRPSTDMTLATFERRAKQYYALATSRYSNQVLVQPSSGDIAGQPTFEEAFTWLSNERDFFTDATRLCPGASEVATEVLKHIALHMSSVKATRTSVKNTIIPRLPFESLEERVEFAKNAGLSVHDSGALSDSHKWFNIDFEANRTTHCPGW